MGTHVLDHAPPSFLLRGFFHLVGKRYGQRFQVGH